MIIELILVAVFIIPPIFSVKNYVVTSGSMEPKYPVGSLIYVKEINIDSLQKGEAITFYMSNSDIVATHEIYDINKKEKKITTYGINNRDAEGNIIMDAVPVDFDKVIGKPIFCIPYLGYLNKYITSTTGRNIVLFLTFLTIIISFLTDFNEKRKVERKNEKK